jgi:hypothetical protein
MGKAYAASNAGTVFYYGAADRDKKRGSSLTWPMVRLLIAYGICCVCETYKELIGIVVYRLKKNRHSYECFCRKKKKRRMPPGLEIRNQ